MISPSFPLWFSYGFPMVFHSARNCVAGHHPQNRPGRPLKSLSPAASSVSRNTRPLIPRVFLTQKQPSVREESEVPSFLFSILKTWWFLVVLGGYWCFLMVLDGSWKWIFILESSSAVVKWLLNSAVLCIPNSPIYPVLQGTVQDGLPAEGWSARLEEARGLIARLPWRDGPVDIRWY